MNQFFSLLKRTEKYTKTDMLYLFKNGSWSLLSQLVGSFSSFIVVLVLASTISKTALGEYRFILSIVSLLTLFTLPGIGTAMLRAVARGAKINLKEIISEKIKWGYLGSLAAVLISLFYFLQEKNELGYGFLVVAVFLPYIETFYVYIAYYKGIKDFKTASRYDSFSRVFQSTFIIVVALATKNVIAIVAAFLVGQIISRLFFFKKTKKLLLSAQENVVESVADDTIPYGKHLSLTSITSTIQGSLDKVLIGYFFGPEILAVYYIALTIPNNIVLIFNIIPRLALPKFSINNWGQAERKGLINKIALFSLLLIAPAMVYMLVTPYILPLLFPAYQSSITLSALFGVLIVISPLVAIVEQVLSARKLVRRIFSIQLAGIGSYLLFFFLLHSRFGITGAGLALVTSSLITLLVGILSVKR